MSQNLRPEDQPKIQEQVLKKQSQIPFNTQSSNKFKTVEQQRAFLKQRLQKIRKNHPDCIPILFMKHPEAPKSVKAPTNSFVLFKRQFKIDQAMITLYKQIDQKGLFFFCPFLSGQKQELKYAILRPGPTIEQVYGKYGRNGYLTIVYSDKNIGMQGLMKIQKWVIRLLVIIFVVWVVIYGMSYYQKWTGNTSSNHIYNSQENQVETLDFSQN